MQRGRAGNTESMESEPVIHIAVEPRTKAGQEKNGDSPQSYRKDPYVQARMDPETGQTIISGMGELHLKSLLTG